MRDLRVNPRVIRRIYWPRFLSTDRPRGARAVKRICTRAAVQGTITHTDREAGVDMALELLELVTP
jgi:hypothetical protein